MQDTEVTGNKSYVSDCENNLMLSRSGLSCFASKTLLAKALEMAISEQVMMMMMTVIMILIM